MEKEQNLKKEEQDKKQKMKKLLQDNNTEDSGVKKKGWPKGRPRGTKEERDMDKINLSEEQKRDIQE